MNCYSYIPYKKWGILHHPFDDNICMTSPCTPKNNNYFLTTGEAYSYAKLIT